LLNFHSSVWAEAAEASALANAAAIRLRFIVEILPCVLRSAPAARAGRAHIRDCATPPQVG
jgi:hypothetical protein